MPKSKNKRKNKKNKRKSQGNQDASAARGALTGMRRNVKNVAGGQDKSLRIVAWLGIGVFLLVFALGFIRC